MDGASLRAGEFPPSAIFWSQTRTLAIANLKSRYRKTFAGFLWVVINPVIMYSVQSLVFKTFLKLNIDNYPLFLLSGLLPWIFISQTLEMCTPLFISNGQLLKSFPVHPFVYLAAQVWDNLINFLAAFFVILIPVWIWSPGKTVGLVLLPLSLIVLACGVLGMSLLLATLQVFLRDTRFVLSFVLSVFFFMTPVFYSPDYVPERYHWLIHINPFHRLIQPFRDSIYQLDLRAFASSISIAAALALSLLMVSLWFWKRRRNAVYLNL